MSYDSEPQEVLIGALLSRPLERAPPCTRLAHSMIRTVIDVTGAVSNPRVPTTYPQASVALDQRHEKVSQLFSDDMLTLVHSSRTESTDRPSCTPQAVTDRVTAEAVPAVLICMLLHHSIVKHEYWCNFIDATTTRLMLGTISEAEQTSILRVRKYEGRTGLLR